MAKDFVDFILDIETTGKRGWHSVRSPYTPPRITQFGLIRVDPQLPGGHIKLIGADVGRGWTDILSSLIEKHKPLTEFDLTPEFWSELSQYDPSVSRGGMLQDQVRAHVRDYLNLKTTSKTGSMLSAEQYISKFQKAIQTEIDRGHSVRLFAYNKGFDIHQIYKELSVTNPRALRDFHSWLETTTSSGKLVVRGAESNVHRAMFEAMLKDQGLVPRFASSKTFEAAMRAGLKPQDISLNAYSKHHGLRELVSDIARVRAGESPDVVYKGMPNELRQLLGKVSSKDSGKLWNQFESYQDALSRRPDLEKLATSHYKRRVLETQGVEMAKHVKTPSFEYVAGWRQDLIAKLLGLGPVPHIAVDDAVISMKLMEKTADPATREWLGREILGNKEILLSEAQEKYAKYILEHGEKAVPSGVRRALGAGTAQTAKLGPSVVSRLARSPIAPFLAAAGGLYMAMGAARALSSDKLDAELDPMREKIRYRLQGIRRAVSQWDLIGGISASKMPGANVSDFGSGRWDAVWASGSYKGVPLHPDVYRSQQLYAANPEWQYQEQLSEARAAMPSPWGLSKEELANQRLNMADYIYEVTDADSILLRRAWLSKNIPLLGPAVGALQKAFMNASRSVTGSKMGFEVRIQGIDAPETEHPGYGDYWINKAQPGAEWATGLMQGYMSDATHIQLKPGATFGRYVGTPMAGQVDIAGRLVQAGGAIALSMKGSPSPYTAQEAMAYGGGEGIWQEPFFQGIMEAKKRRIRPILSHLQKHSTLGRSLQAATAYSLAAYHMNPHMAKVRDQYAQNAYVMPGGMSNSAHVPQNMGAIYS